MKGRYSVKSKWILQVILDSNVLGTLIDLVLFYYDALGFAEHAIRPLIYTQTVSIILPRAKTTSISCILFNCALIHYSKRCPWDIVGARLGI